MLRDVVVVNDNARITGGADKIALASARGLADRGYGVHLLTAGGPENGGWVNEQQVHITSTNQFEILHDPNRLRAAVQGLWNLKSYRAAERLFAGLDPKNTVVHLHLWAKALSSSVVRVAVESGFSIACTLHDYMLACPVGTMYDHSQQTICTRTPMSARCIAANCDSRSYGDKLWRVTRGAIQRSAGRLPTGLTDIIAISELVLSKMKPYLPETARVHKLSNFIDLEKGEATPVGQNSAFAFVGRLVDEKGALLFAQAARDEGVKALFLGEGPCRGGIHSILPSAEISGWLPEKEMLEALRTARALVFPSRWYEAQPLVVMEAMAQGIPCLVADTSAAREMVLDGETGLLFRGGDLADLTSKLRSLSNPFFAATLGQNAYRAYWNAPRTLDLHLDGLEEIYETMLKSGTPSTHGFEVMA